MIKFRPPSNRKEYHRICKEWDSITEPESSGGSKFHWKGVLAFVIVIACFVGLGYALSKAKQKNRDKLSMPMYPYLYNFGDEAMYNENLYDQDLYNPDLYEEDDSNSYVMNSNVGDHVYDYDSTYNGYEMSGFVSTIYHLLEDNVTYINEYNKCFDNNIDTKETLATWNDKIDNYENSLNEQVHHSSFDPAYQETMDYIAFCRKLIANPELLHGEALSDLNEKTHSIMDRICEAFDKNSIRYTKKDNGEIKFWYEKY